jgi:hypothetical protein
MINNNLKEGLKIRCDNCEYEVVLVTEYSVIVSDTNKICSVISKKQLDNYEIVGD